MHHPVLSRRALTAAALLAASAPLCAQTHKVAKPETVVRAVGVYEWTGEMAKPNAMRLIPVSLFIDGRLEDAGVYLARPVPFALVSGDVYEVQQSGVPKGTIDLTFARHFEAPTTASANVIPFDDGWFGYGKFISPAPPQKSNLRPSKTVAKIDLGDDDDTRPKFSSKSATPGTGGSASNIPGSSQTASDTPADDPDRPTLHRSGSSSPQNSSTTNDSGSNPAADPDRPTLHRSASDTGASSRVPDDPSIEDPDRPTLRRRSPQQAESAKTDKNGIADVPSLNDDPNRPTLHRGKPAGSAAADDFHQLSGLPPEQDLRQMVAVSDAATRSMHDFNRPWTDAAERQAILTTMESAAQTQLAAYAVSQHPKPAAADARHPNSKLRRGVPADTQTAPPAKLLDEQLKAYTLSYGAPATYVFAAHTEGDGAALQYITLVAELDMHGDPQVVLKSVTDAAHLDRTPRMRLVDVVDADASNRASLLFELREQSSRQFALYRVLGERADQIFLTGTTQ